MIFHERILRFSRAVTGIVLRIKTVKKSRVFFKSTVDRQLGKMESADQNIGSEPPCDIEDTSVRTSAEEDTSADLFDQELLLVTEIVGQKFPVLLHCETE